jgi:hypothetical protein
VRHAAAEHLVEHYAEAVDVGAAIDTVSCARDLLRGHVARAARDDPEHAASRLRFIQAEPEIHKYWRAVGGEEDVGGFDVAVDDEPGVGVDQGVGHGGRDPGCLRPPRAVALQPLCKTWSVQEIRDEINLSLMDAHVVDCQDPWVAVVVQRLFGALPSSACLVEN